MRLTERTFKLESICLPSEAIGRDMRSTIYLPPGYRTDCTYPVLYLLYGCGGDENSWFTQLHIGEAADRLIESNLIAPMIIVSPCYGNSFGFHSKSSDASIPVGVDAGCYEDYFIRELIPYIDRNFSTMRSKQGRRIGGASMGGYMALMLGLSYPEMFDKIGAHSAVLWTYNSSDQYTNQRDWLYPCPALRELRDPYMLARGIELKELSIYLDAGVDDPLAEKDQLLYEQLYEQGIPARWESSSGGHNLAYWTSRIDDYLNFYAGSDI